MRVSRSDLLRRQRPVRAAAAAAAVELAGGPPAVAAHVEDGAEALPEDCRARGVSYITHCVRITLSYWFGDCFLANSLGLWA